MSKLKKLTIISVTYNVILFLLLFFQTAFIYSIIEKNLFPTFRFIKPLLEKNFIEFIKNRLIIAVITIFCMIIIEIILFFVINWMFQKKYSEFKQNGETAKFTNIMSKYYKYMNIHVSIFLIVFILSVSYYSFNLISISNDIDLSMNNKTINSVYEIAMETSIDNLADIEGFVDVSIKKIKNDSEIYKFVVQVINFVDIIYYINRFFYMISYVALIFGIYKGTRLYFNLNKKEVNYE